MKALAIIGYVGMLVAGYAWEGYVLSILWGWFMVTTFGLPAIGIGQAIGLSTIIQIMRPNRIVWDEPEVSFATKAGRAAAILFLLPALGLFTGWIVSA